MSVDCWKRPNFDEMEWFNAAEDDNLDVITHNTHLLENKVMSFIISSIHCLEELGRKRLFEQEFQNSTFFYNGGLNWKPWNHVYALTKAGKGSQHVLNLNKSGLYAVRLYYMGNWRRILVDDFLPYNTKGEVLLPRTKNTCNLWPLILSKALLRVASQSWTVWDETNDFSPICCLTGWTRYVIDCRVLSYESMWDIVQMYLVIKEYPEEEKKPFCISTSQNCLNDSSQYYCYDNIHLRTLLATIQKTETGLDRISPAPEHLAWLLDAQSKLDEETANLPAWKKLRWIKWAHENNEQTFGVIKQTVSIYSPHRKKQLFNPYSRENLKIVADKIVSGEIKTGNLKAMLLQHATSSDDAKKQSMGEEFLSYDFSNVFPFIREFEVFYKSSHFENTHTFTDLDKIAFNDLIEDKFRLPSDVKGGKLRASATISKENYKMRCVYFYSNTSYCKNFFITLSTCSSGNESYIAGYINCEEFNWKSVIMGKLLFHLSTKGTKTARLQLGSGVQVCRLWYDLPTDFNLLIQSKSSFELLNENELWLKLSQYSAAFVNFGEKICEDFKILKKGVIRTPEHYSLINHYKKSFYPPVFETFIEEYKTKLIQDYNEVFIDCLAELIFEQYKPLIETAACLDAMGLVFNDEKIGLKIIDSFSSDERAEFHGTKSLPMKSMNDYKTFLETEFNKFFKSHGIHKTIQAAEMSPKTRTTFNKKLSVGISSASTISSTRDKPLTQVEVDPEVFSFLENPLNSIELLRKILNRKKEYLQWYPFQNEHVLKLKYCDYSGSTEIKLHHKWFLVARLLMNVHSETPVPCIIKVKTTCGNVVLLVYEIDTCKEVICNFDVNKTFLFRRNKLGYAVLVYGHPEYSEMINVTVSWKIRIIGVDQGNILHFCYTNPFLCPGLPLEPLSIHLQSISGFYFPNTEHIIARFQIKLKSSSVVTLFISVARNDAQIEVVIRGGEKNICEVEGSGEIMIPVLLLENKSGVESLVDPEVSIFRGEIKLVGAWPFTKEEKLFVKHLRSSSKKDLLSLEDFDSFSLDDLGPDSDEELDDEEFNFDDKNNSIYSKKHKMKKEEDSSDDSDLSIPSETNFYSSQLGLLSYSPFWRISMIVDDINKDDTSLEKDDNKIKDYELFKRTWEDEDPGREERAEILRKEFLKFWKSDFLQAQLDPDELVFSDFSEDGTIEVGELSVNSSHMFTGRKKTRRPPILNKMKRTVVRDGHKHVTSIFQSLNAFLAGFPPKLDAVTDLHRAFCEKEHCRALIEDRTAPTEKSVTKTLIKTYSKPSEKVILKAFDLDSFDLTLSPEQSYENITIKELKKKCLEDNDFTRFVEEIVEPILWPLTKDCFPESLLEVPEEFSGNALLELSQQAEESFQEIKRQRDTLLQELQQLILSKKDEKIKSI